MNYFKFGNLNTDLSAAKRTDHIQVSIDFCKILVHNIFLSLNHDNSIFFQLVIYNLNLLNHLIFSNPLKVLLKLSLKKSLKSMKNYTVNTPIIISKYFFSLKIKWQTNFIKFELKNIKR